MSGTSETNPALGDVLWSGSSQDLTALATGGRVQTGSYTVTTDAIRFSSGVISTREEVIPIWLVVDADINQHITQRVRGVGDVVLRLDPAHAGRYGQKEILLDSVENPSEVRDLILRQANTVRRYWSQHHYQRDVELRRAGAASTNFAVMAPPNTVPPVPVPVPAAEPAPALESAPAGGGDLMAQLVKLGEMKTAGLLTDEEFAAAKAKLLA
ncbi:PH domain-containing protein [Actinoplanes sp. NPDC026670]|uniref:PH domain-containing protein n=1 Tax=Actinoplanes sp. NPDC026670 TaxID=3154700 RepID=UPI0033C7BC81